MTGSRSCPRRTRRASARCTQQPLASLVRSREATRDAQSALRRWLVSRSVTVGALAVLGRALADTGALLALLDRRDRWHERCAFAFAELRLPLLTTAAVLAELFHLVRRSRLETSTTWRFLQSGAITVAPIADRDMASLETLMNKYSHRPMDFADATLVHLARRESLTTIFTIDAADFSTYRVDGRKRFRIVPGGER